MKRCVVIGAVELDFPAENLIRDTDFEIALGLALVLRLPEVKH